jgi:hypothetical protein
LEKPKDRFKVNDVVSNVMPVPVTFPEPELPRTGGTSLDGLSPTALSVPDGDKSNKTTAPWRLDTTVSTASRMIFFIELSLLSD